MLAAMVGGLEIQKGFDEGDDGHETGTARGESGEKLELGDSLSGFTDAGFMITGCGFKNGQALIIDLLMVVELFFKGIKTGFVEGIDVLELLGEKL